MHHYRVGIGEKQEVIMTKNERMFKIAKALWCIVQVMPEKTFQECKKWFDEIEELLNEEMNDESNIDD